MTNTTGANEWIKETIYESNNPIVNMMRNLYDRVFAANEMGIMCTSQNKGIQFSCD